MPFPKLAEPILRGTWCNRNAHIIGICIFTLSTTPYKNTILKSSWRPLYTTPHDLQDDITSRCCWGSETSCSVISFTATQKIKTIPLISYMLFLLKQHYALENWNPNRLKQGRSQKPWHMLSRGSGISSLQLSNILVAQQEKKKLYLFYFQIGSLKAVS